jgi:hypothetical protein
LLDAQRVLFWRWRAGRRPGADLTKPRIAACGDKPVKIAGLGAKQVINTAVVNGMALCHTGMLKGGFVLAEFWSQQILPAGRAWWL